MIERLNISRVVVRIEDNAMDSSLKQLATRR